MRAALLALLVGVGATAAALVTGFAAFAGVVRLAERAGWVGGLALVPLLVPVLVTSVGFGLWASRRCYRRMRAQR